MQSSILSALSRTQSWATQNLGKMFEAVIWSDETSFQMETHHRFHCYKRGQELCYKPRPKHPVKVHVWAGISCCGLTGVCIFLWTLSTHICLSNTWFLSSLMCIQQGTSKSKILGIKKGDIGIVEKARGQVWSASVVQSLCSA